LDKLPAVTAISAVAAHSDDHAAVDQFNTARERAVNREGRSTCCVATDNYAAANGSNNSAALVPSSVNGQRAEVCVGLVAADREGKLIGFAVRVTKRNCTAGHLKQRADV
jgi:hypothetical protein